LAVAWPFVFSLIAITFVLKQISQFYLDHDFRSDFGKRFTSVSKFLILPPDELKWTERLYGIYNDFVVRIRWPEYFKDNSPETIDVRRRYTSYIDMILAKKLFAADHPEGFPNHYVVDDELPVPPLQSEYPILRREEYKLDFRDPKHFKRTPDKTGAYRWIYKIKPSFYKHLHRQLFVISLTSLIVLLLITSPFNLLSDHIGAPALVCLSFGCWQGIYIGLLYLDACAFRYFPLSIRWLLLGWLLFCSYFNVDHPVRTIPAIPGFVRPTLTDHFARWKAKHEDSIYARRCMLINPCTPADTSKPQCIDSTYPVIFITAEGGALRTGAFTALLLSALQDSFPGFRNDIYSFSSISGGTLGISFFNAITYLNPDTSIRPGAGYYTNLTRNFFDRDQLSPVLSKMFYGDPISALSLWPIQPFDRAIALETAWQDDYRDLFPQSNIYSMGFLDRYRDTTHIRPAWFINTTEVETGLQCYLSNVRPTSFVFDDQRDLLDGKIRDGVRYSTAVNFSSRFPLISPSAALRQDEGLTYHYVDGGYVENTGAKTMLELLTALKTNNLLTHITPYVIQIRFNSDNSIPNTGFLNEFSSILYGIYDTRNGSSSTSAELLKKYTFDLKGKYISVPLISTSAEVPVNWVLSERSMHHLLVHIDSLMRAPDNLDHTVNELHDLYWFDSNYVRKFTCPPLVPPSTGIKQMLDSASRRRQPI
ncbi:MAG TPA: hypothetical protein VNV35_04170, partial [Puia sp.]|nr:hypothetical protein [Puia sp.]